MFQHPGVFVRQEFVSNLDVVTVFLSEFLRMSSLATGNDVTLRVFKVKGKGKGKAVPLQTWSGPEGSTK
jgi:hypothetical protein